MEQAITPPMLADNVRNSRRRMGAKDRGIAAPRKKSGRHLVVSEPALTCPYHG